MAESHVLALYYRVSYISLLRVVRTESTVLPVCV